ncbi:hypothetical protein BSL78_01427 [Apostichopus japonicus]|uniref:PWWP domain-containing protein n=1 Tax=Stichopus japonicus TaxID=307972 RepID=A0A2G8LMY0_STIJA|nr:hypothetical protein BSL78_01427 [Apostichopus japonicus]
MNPESDSDEEEELVVGKVTETNPALKGAGKRTIVKGVHQKTKGRNRVKVLPGYRDEDLPPATEDSEPPDKRKKNETCVTESCMKGLSKGGVVDGLKNKFIEQEELKPSKQRYAATRSSQKKSLSNIPSNIQRPHRLNLRSLKPRRIILKGKEKVDGKKTTTEKARERESSEERELIVGNPQPGELWFEQLNSNPTNDQRHNKSENNVQEKKDQASEPKTDSAGLVRPSNQEDATSRLVEVSTEFSEPDSDDELIDPSLEIDEEEYEEGDLVWARHPWNPFWPAIVKDVVPGRQSKITVQYLNAGFDVYTCQYSIRAIRPFIRDKKKFMAEGLESEQAESFKVAVEEAMDYLQKRALGSSPVRDPSSTIACQSMESPPLTPTECMVHPLKVICSTPGEGYISSPSPELRVGHPPGFWTEEQNCRQDAEPDTGRLQKRKKWEKVEDRLVKQILKDETKERLVKIWKGQIKSTRHTRYFSSSHKDRDTLKYNAKLGALTTDEKASLPNILISVFNSS